MWLGMRDAGRVIPHVFQVGQAAAVPSEIRVNLPVTVGMGAIEDKLRRGRPGDRPVAAHLLHRAVDAAGRDYCSVRNDRKIPALRFIHATAAADHATAEFKRRDPVAMQQCQPVAMRMVHKSADQVFDQFTAGMNFNPRLFNHW